MTNTTTQIVIGQLVHNEDIYSLPVIEGRSAVETLKLLNDAGYKMGSTSLRNLINGVVEKACGFSFIKTTEEAEVVETETQAPAVEQVVERVEAEPVESEPVVTTRHAWPTIPRKPDPVVVEVKVSVVEEKKAEEQPAAVEAPKVDSKVKPMRRGTKNDKIFKMLCAGATIKEICESTGWSEGAVSSVVYWEPNYKGYGLDKEKVDGRGLVIYLTIEGVRIDESKLVYNK